jgi:hypothetical protein|tara:strand:- start:229 stop:432 length:204 start_codon:yes stop_codon:yes gene_type:complete
MNSRKENTHRKSKNESKNYWPVRIRVDGNAVWILLTDNEVIRAAKRAESNPEDLPTIWQKIKLNFGF